MKDRELLELNEQCQALIDGAISDADRARLGQRLADSEEARLFYVRSMALSASLMEYSSEMQSEALEPVLLLPANDRPARGLWWTMGSLAAAAILMIGLWFGSRGIHLEEGALTAADKSEEAVGRLSATKDTRWSGPAPGAGEELHQGQQIKLLSGLVEIAFHSGAVVTLAGPAALQLTSAWEAVLHRGTLKAQVPPEAVGFRVANAAVEVIDLGTEFSMVAGEDGATEVFVLKGAVETRVGEGGQPVVLHEREARRFAPKGSSEVRDREQKWRRLAGLRAMERKEAPLHFAHWSFDETSNGVFAARTSGFVAETLAAKFDGHSSDLTGGRFQNALPINGSQAAKVDLSGIGLGEVRTAAFWLKVPVDASLSEAGPVLAWELPRQLKVEIGWNPQPSLGPLGALRMNIGRGLIVGTTPLRDGSWHHVAVVMTPGRRSPEKMQIRRYIDGRLDGIAERRSLKRGRAARSAGDRLLWIGLSPNAPGETFRGAIDELFIASRALSPLEIRSLMQANQLSPVPMVAQVP